MTRDQFIAELILVTESQDWGRDLKDLQAKFQERLQGAYDSFRQGLQALYAAGKLHNDTFLYDSVRNEGMRVSFVGKFVSYANYDVKLNVELRSIEP